VQQSTEKNRVERATFLQSCGLTQSAHSLSVSVLYIFCALDIYLLYIIATNFTSVTNKMCVVLFYSVGQDSAVGIATRYGLDVPGIESRWG
jgi:hypothetical protein